MKKYFKYSLLFAAVCILSAGFTSCKDDDEDGPDLGAQNAEIKAITNEYLNSVVYPTYTNLANETESLFGKISALKTKLKAGTTVQQSEIDAICTSYKTARKHWEESEAFLYGAASDFEIDPHIDTWPLDVPTLAADLADDAKIARLDAADGIDYARTNLTAENLGFHGLEFIFFRNGKNRDVAIFNNDVTEDDANFAGKNVTGKEEVIFATAVAGDLRDKCFQLEVAWNPNASAAHKSRVAECAKTSDDFETKVAKNGLTYGEDLAAIESGNSSIGTSWKKVLETILVSGCSNICAEVADQKMGQAYRAATSSTPTYHEGEDGGQEQDDPNYIESPYSHNSFTDFYGNIISIQNSLYNNLGGSSAISSSLMSYLTKYNPDMARELDAKLKVALQALVACQNSRVAFVDAPGAPYVKTAMDAIGQLDEALNEAADWILKN